MLPARARRRWPDTPHTWDHQLAAGTGAGFRVVAPWLRGYPPTEIPRSGYFDIGTVAGHAASLFGAAGMPAGREPAGNLVLAALNAVAGDRLGPGCCLGDHRSEVPLLAGASHYTISATVTANPASPLGIVVGDLLVQPASAHGLRGARQHMPFPVHLGQGFGGMHHFDLLNHPGVWAAIRGLLSAGT